MASCAVTGGIATNLSPAAAANDRWFMNVPLTTNGSSQAVMSHQNGGLIETNSINWVPVNVLALGNYLARKGDTVLFTATPPSASNGTFTVTIGTNQYTSGYASPVPHQFSAVGTNVVVATYQAGNGVTQSGQITVIVLDHSFADSPVGQVGMWRTWTNNNFFAGVVMEADSRIATVPQTSSSSNRVDKFTADENVLRYVNSRAGNGGPILSVAQVRGTYMVKSDGGAQLLQTYSDGSQLIETHLVQSFVQPDVVIQVKIIVGGVTFDDGTTTKTFTSASFGSLGVIAVRFIRQHGIPTSNCHQIYIYQNGQYIGTI